MVREYPLFDIYWDENDIEKVSNVIRRGSYWAVGPEIREFEEKMEKYFNIKNVITFNSGTSALHAVLLAHEITSGEVIVPSLSFISTANCVILAGAKPIFAEIEEESIGLDQEDVKNRINKNTKAIIPMHYGGRCCKYINELREIADDYNLIMIEDNAESFGAKINDKLAGTIGESSILSFCQNKILPTGEGGAVCTNNNQVKEKLKLIRSHGRVEQPGVNYFSNINEMDYIEIGHNYRIPTICAALGLSQFEKIDKIIELRREKGEFYDKHLVDIPELQILHELKGFKNVYQLYSVFLKELEMRSSLQEFLLKRKIYTKIYFPPIHLKSFYKKKFGYKEGDFPITEKISKKLLTLPFSLNFKDEDQKHIINQIDEFFNQFR